MSRVWLVLDVPYLCWRAFHSVGRSGLSHDGAPTGVLYGFFKGLSVLTQQHATDNFVFCFDHGVGLREQLDCGYKEGRRAKILTDEEKRAIVGMRKQVDKLKTKTLKDLGYQNVFMQDGYEADDLIASVCMNTREKDEVVIVSADKDLYQLLSPRVCMWDPFKRQAMTFDLFMLTYDTNPYDWNTVKALAGCPTDNVYGVKGVGEKTAISWVNGARMGYEPKFKKGIDERISAFIRSEQWKLNLKLVTLPYPGCQKFVPKVESPPDVKTWNKVMSAIGMKSLIGSVPNYSGFGLNRRV